MTVPAVVVFLAVYFTFRQYHQQQTRIHLLQNKQSRDKVILPMRLQAYERLILLCERIDFAELMLRLITPGTSAKELQAAMMITIQQEYEHNLTQQLYITSELWQVLMAAKSKSMDLITIAGQGMPDHATADDFAKKILQLISEENAIPSQIGKKAIKTEASLWL